MICSNVQLWEHVTASGLQTILMFNSKHFCASLKSIEKYGTITEILTS